jgi:hypothetical protein
MHTTVIAGIEVSYTFHEGREGGYMDEPIPPTVSIKTATINSQEAWDFIHDCTDEDEAYEFSQSLSAIQDLVLDYHLSHCR